MCSIVFYRRKFSSNLHEIESSVIRLEEVGCVDGLLDFEIKFSEFTELP